MSTIERRVTAADTARAVGSGDLEVLGTPVLIAWCEAATCAALNLPPERTSVGIRVDIEHLAASPVGALLTVTADLQAENSTERRVSFGVRAVDAAGTVVGQGEVLRAVVDRERFLARLPDVTP